MDSAGPARASSFGISPNELWNLIVTANTPQVIDTRRRAIHDSAPGLLPTALWRDIADIERWSAALDRNRPIVFACRFGHQMSQIPTAHLRAAGFDARVLAGGHEAWAETKLPFVTKAALDRLAPRRPSLWVTRRWPKIDRIACPWLILRFIDAQARILYVDADQVAEVAKETGAVPFDIKGVEIGHDGERCSFDALLRVFGLEAEPASRASR